LHYEILCCTKYGAYNLLLVSTAMYFCSPAHIIGSVFFKPARNILIVTIIYYEDKITITPYTVLSSCSSGGNDNYGRLCIGSRFAQPDNIYPMLCRNWARVMCCKFCQPVLRGSFRLSDGSNQTQSPCSRFAYVSYDSTV